MDPIVFPFSEHPDPGAKELAQRVWGPPNGLDGHHRSAQRPALRLPGARPGSPPRRPSFPIAQRRRFTRRVAPETEPRWRGSIAAPLYWRTRQFCHCWLSTFHLCPLPVGPRGHARRDFPCDFLKFWGKGWLPPRLQRPCRVPPRATRARPLAQSPNPRLFPAWCRGRTPERHTSGSL